MRWVTWKDVGVDRMACAWLIRTRIDPQAEFTFIPAGTSPLPEGMEPFDIPGVRFSHHRGHCSFYALLKEHQIKDPILQHIARIVDEADVVQEVALEPAAPGLDLVCRGLSRTSRDDNEAIDWGCRLYDALFAELSANSE
jgi:hypothetical protein